MKKLMLGLMMAFAATAAMAENVSYLNYDAASGTFVNAEVECTIVPSGTTEFSDGGWYVAKGTNTCAGTITVSGSAHLILADDAELTVNSGIHVTKGNSLTIYGQGEGGGKLIAKSGVNGSTIPDIGGGSFGESCGAITVNGGIVDAEKGGIGGAGVITAGRNGGDGGSLTVNGGWVIASKIGGGEASKISIGGGGGAGSPGRGTVVTFAGGVTESRNGIFTYGDPNMATYMKVVEGDFNVASYIKVEEQERQNTRDVVFVLGECVISITTDYTGESMFEGNRVTLKDAKVGAQIGIEVTCAPGFEYRGATEFVVRADESPHELNAVPMPVEVLESVEYAVPGESTLSVARNVATVVPGPHTFTNGGWYVTRSKWSCGVIEVNGSANLILADGAELTVDGGIRVTEGNSLTIYGQSEGSGKLIVTGAEGCAGIGGGIGDKGADGQMISYGGWAGGSGESCGAVTINGGEVVATGGRGAAGIGGGAGGAGGNAGTADPGGQSTIITFGGIPGGDGGAGGSGGTLTINDGKVTLTGGNGAAGIGGGVGGTGGIGYQAGEGIAPAGKNGAKGAGATVSFQGGVTKVQNGILTEGEPILGVNMGVTGVFNEMARIVVFDVDLIAPGDRDRPWKAGTSVTAWTNGTGRLVIQGSGTMYDFEDAASVPWAGAADEVTTVTVEGGVTHIGKNVFAEMDNLVSINGENVESTYRTVSTVNGKSIEQFNMMGDALGNGTLVYPSAEPVIPDDMVLVAQTELQAAKAEAVTVADGVVSLGVTVNTNGNFTAEAKSWAPVELKPENVKVENGKIVITIPVDSQSGFMILQSGDAKVSEGGARVPVTGEPWYKPTVED